MQIQGSSLVKLPRARVWQLLNDPAVLARCTPGLSRLDREGENRYAATFTVAIGPVKGNFNGHITVSDQVPEEAMTLTVNAKSPVGVIAARGHLQLADEGPDTRVTWTGEPQLMGTLAAVGARLVQSVAKSQVDTFFTRLEQEAAHT
ncbi:MAG TPA: carbon monoxide dehydrogenase subunit G [Vicinamibacterales bacterium]